jgi:hypothetical protein
LTVASIENENDSQTSEFGFNPKSENKIRRLLRIFQDLLKRFSTEEEDSGAVVVEGSKASDIGFNFLDSLLSPSDG